jgi:hypothetical protein
MKFKKLAILGVYLAIFPALSIAQKGKNPPPPPPKPKIPKMIYISDFDLDFVTPEDAPKPAPDPAAQPKGSTPLIPAPHAKLSPDHPPKWHDPAARAQHIVGLMSTGVVDGISQKHLPARRLFQGDPLPTEGILLRGVFVESAPPNHFRRVAIGAAPLPRAQTLLLITLTDLALPDQPLYHFAKDDGSFPGPGALIALNPRLTIIKFELDPALSDKVVNKLASQVAKEISIRINPPPPD